METAQAISVGRAKITAPTIENYLYPKIGFYWQDWTKLGLPSLLHFKESRASLHWLVASRLENRRSCVRDH